MQQLLGRAKLLFCCAELLYKYAIPTPKDQCSKSLQLGVSFAGGYVADVFCAVVSHPADNLVSKCPRGNCWRCCEEAWLVGFVYSRSSSSYSHDRNPHRSTVGVFMMLSKFLLACQLLAERHLRNKLFSYEFWTELTLTCKKKLLGKIYLEIE